MMIYVKRLILITTILLVAPHITAQPKRSSIYDTFWHKYDTDLASKAGLLPFIKSNHNSHYRLFESGDVIGSWIDVYKTNIGTFNGQVVFYTQEWVDESKEKPTHRIYSKQFAMTSKQAADAYNLLHSNHIEQLPTDTAIKGWELGNDGIVYSLEYADRNQYSFKAYWTPSAHRNVKEAEFLQHTIDRLFTIVNIKNLSARFVKNVPFERYSVDAGRVAIHPKITWKQLQQYRKERDIYRYQHHIQ